MAAQAYPANRAISLVRILAGIMFLCEGYLKLSGGFLKGGFARQAAVMAEKGYPFWHPILHRFVVPHPVPFAWAVALGETLLGLSLLSGLLVRWASVAGIFLMIVIGLGNAWPAPGASLPQYVTAWLVPFAYAGLLLIFAASNAGKTWGLDSRR